MISWLVDFITGILGFLSSVLPDSPFQDVLEGLDGVALGLGWLNWFVPIGSLAAVFAAYLAVLLIWVSVQAALDNSIKGVFGVIGGD